MKILFLITVNGHAWWWDFIICLSIRDEIVEEEIFYWTLTEDGKLLKWFGFV